MNFRWLLVGASVGALVMPATASAFGARAAAVAFPEVTDVTTGSVTSTSALASAVINPNGAATTYNFFIRRAGESEWAAFSGATIPATNGPTPVAGEANLLNPDTGYEVRLTAINEAGVVETTGLAFRTLQAPSLASLTVSSLEARVSRRSAYFTSLATVSSAGSVTQTATTGSGKKTKTWCSAMTTARNATSYPLKCNLGAKGRRYLKKKSLSLTVTTTLRTASGASATDTRSLTIKRKR